MSSRPLQAGTENPVGVTSALVNTDTFAQSSAIHEPKTFHEAFKGLRSFIEHKIDTSHGLLEELLKRRVLTKAHVDDIYRLNGDEYGKANRLMRILERRPDGYLTEFYNALKVTEQSEIVQRLKYKGTSVVRKIATLTACRNESVVGVTWLHTRIYAVHFRANTIAVFEPSPFSEETFIRLEDIVVADLQGPNDIAASVNRRCLYVPDVGSRVVWCVKASNGKVVPWLSAVLVYTLSVTSDDHLVMLVLNDGQDIEKERNISWHGKIHIYGPDAIIENVITLSFDIIGPLHIVMTNRNTFIVSCGGSWHERNGVCEVDMNGEIVNVKPFFSKPGSGSCQLNMPCHLSLYDDDLLIVLDSGNNRMLLLDKHLQLQRVLVNWKDPESSTDNPEAPFRLHCDAQKKRLLVGLGSRHIDIYQIA